MKTNLPLAGSLLLNLALAAGASYLWARRPDAAPPASPTAPLTASPLVVPTKWKEIESDDPMIYKRNLHLLGCPEEIIHCIMAAKEPSAASLPNPAAVPENNSSMLVSTPAAGRIPETLSASSQTSVAAPAYGGNRAEQVASGQSSPVDVSSSPGEASVSATSGWIGGAPSSSGQARAAMPLVFQPVSMAPAAPASGSVAAAFQPSASAGLTLSPEQNAAIGQVQQGFVDQLNGTSQNPNDPAYAQRWNAAQKLADDLQRAMLGDAKFNEFQLNAAQSATQGK